MILQTREWVGEMLDGMTGMNDIEAGVGQRDILDARLNQFGARQTGTGIGIAFVGLDRRDAPTAVRSSQPLDGRPPGVALIGQF